MDTVKEVCACAFIQTYSTPQDMDLNNPVVQLCTEGTRAEFERRLNDTHLLYLQAWEARKDIINS